MMKLPRHTPLLRRGLAALLTAAYVVVSLGAARHAGEHDTSGLAWLPEEFHHHDFHLEEQDAPGVAAVDLCAACHFSSPRFRESGSSLAIAPPTIGEPFLVPSTDPRPGLLSERTIRGPPRV